MLLRKHVQLAFVAILALFALNFAINFWSTRSNGMAIEALQQAVSRQALTATINQSIADIQKQVARLGLLRSDVAATPLPTKEIEQMNLQAATIAAQIAMLNTLANDKLRIQVDALQKKYSELAASWGIFYQNFGVNHVQALTELALHTEPLSQHVLHEAIPLLQAEEKQDTESAQKKFSAVQWLTLGTSSSIFIFSLGVAAIITVRTYRRLTSSLGTLQQGVASINSGEDTEHSIALQSNDELGQVAHAVNSLSNSLRTAKTQLAHLDQELAQSRSELIKQQQTSEFLLHNILPASVAEEFRMKGSVETRYMEDVSIIFTDFVNFSSFTEQLAAEDLVRILHEYFSVFDEITARYGLEKLKTIGDSYMCAGGLPVRNPSHPVDAVMAALEIVHAVTQLNNQHNWSIRVGIHTGHLIAGMVGKQKFAYDIWGESVNYASRLESSSEANRITLSEQTYARIKDFFECENRGEVPLKSYHKSALYYVNGILPSLADDFKQIPPPAFLRRYRSYFQKDPPSFPAFLRRFPP